MGYVPGVTLTKWRTRWHERLDARLEVVEIDQDDARRGLDADEVDMCFVRAPFDVTDLHAITVYEEVMVAWVSKDHPIAAFDAIAEADLAEETVLTELDATAIGRVNAGAVLVVPMSIARSASRRDLVHRPIADAEPTPVLLVWRTDNDGPLAQEFVGIVRGRTAHSSRTSQERASRPGVRRDGVRREAEDGTRTSGKGGRSGSPRQRSGRRGGAGGRRGGAGGRRKAR